MRAPNFSQSVDPETNGSLRKDQLAGFDLLRRCGRHSHYIIGNDSFNGINTASLSASRMPFYLINCTDLRRSILRLKAKFHFRDRSATSNFAPLPAKMRKLVNFRFGRSEEHTSELQSLKRTSSTVVCVIK